MKKAAKPHRTRQAPGRPLAVLIGAVAVLLLLASGTLWLIGPRDAAGGPFALTAGDGRTVTDRDFRGRFLVIYFGYTSCRDVCPTTLTALAAAFEQLGAKGRQITPLFITVDPARDTPAVVQRYAGAFMPALIGLTGTPAALRQVAQEYRIGSVIHPPQPGRAGSDIDHSSVIWLVGRDGRAIAALRADQSGAELARALSRYLS